MMTTSHRKIVFDEHEKAKEILKNGFETGKVTKYELSLVAKEYFLLGKTGKKLENALIEFCNKYSANFNEIIYADLISDAIKRAEKYELKKSSDIIITKKELDIIKSVPYKYAKVLFTMVALAKNNKVNNPSKKEEYVDRYFCNSTLREVVRIAKVSATNKELVEIKHFLHAEKDLIHATKISLASWEILIIDNDSEPEIIITDMNHLIDFFPPYCERCGKILEKKNGRHRFCSDCWKNHRKEWDRNRKKNKNS